MDQPSARPCSDRRAAIVDGVLWPCWRGVPENYKVKYARNIWEQFENNIRSAAYTSSLAKFFETLCRKLAIEIRSPDVAAVNAALNHPQPKEILRALREETTMLALMCRLKNQERKESYQKESQPDDDLRIPGPDDGALLDFA